MGGKGGVMTVAGSSRYCRIAVLAAFSFGMICGMSASPASSQSLGDRFKSLFGGKSEEPAERAPPPAPEGENDLTRPPVIIRAGTSTYAVAAPGKQPLGTDLRFQTTISLT